MRAPILLDEAAAWDAICAARRLGIPAGGGPLRLDVAESRLWIERDGGWSIDPTPPAAICRLLELYLPLAIRPQLPFTIAHLGQSLDGRIAAANGASRWVTGPEDLLHNHRMRALADAILVGADTVRLDDPQLTVRRCPGENPVRVVLDPMLGLGPDYALFRDAAAATLVITAADRDPPPRLGRAEVVTVPRAADGTLDCRAIIALLGARGLGWVFVEGGGVTVSRFLAQGALDRLQLTISPLIIGSGRPGIQLPEIQDLAQGLRPRLRRFALGDDMLFECDFS
ncbi:MAG TPA: RibD family protein [Aliidongia sp.]|uniref:RibD family protein n=1 Tax=Aliidongia sp. TaxID=1914230 RepID=UPI002DDCE4A5|nr:RibD family protein [Aliidongia sp.]HEV2675321.1 RibD family protein [Aliidongia sp.]